MSWDGPTLQDSFDRDGVWWLPDDGVGDRVAGRVSFDPAGGVRLKTFGPFAKEPPSEEESPFRPGLILGFWEAGRSVTLCRATRHGVVRYPGSDQGSDFYARYAVDGHHFHAEADVAFYSWKAGFTDLERWAGHRPFTGMTPIPGEDRLAYREMNPVVADVDALGARLTLRSDLSSWGTVPTRTLRWEHRVVLDIEPWERRPLPWYRDTIGILQDFLSLVMGRPVYPSTAEAQAKRGSADRSDVFFDAGLRRREAGASAAGLTRAEDVLLPLREVRDELPCMLRAWFEKHALLGPVHALFFGALFGSDTSTEFRFLGLTQALESYHRRTRPGSRYESEESYRDHYHSIVEGLPSTLPNDLRQSLKSTLQFGNEWSLRKRMKDLLEELPGEGVVEHGREYFARRVVDTRNYLTHWTEELENEALRGPGLREGVDELGRMLAFFLLRETGLGEEKIVAALGAVPRYRYFSLED